MLQDVPFVHWMTQRKLKKSVLKLSIMKNAYAILNIPPIGNFVAQESASM